MFFFSAISIAIYLVWMLVYFFTWGKASRKPVVPGVPVKGIKVSVIVPVRNEENNVGHLIRSVFNQHHLPEDFEMIVVDDHSEDQTEKKISELLPEYQQLKYLKSDGIPGKKAALTSGIKISSGELIITTDADVVFGKQWISKVVGHYAASRYDMIILPVLFYDEKNQIEKLQSLEFLSLCGTTFGAAALGSPVMCGGANLAFKRSSFDKVGGYNGNDRVTSGDDMFLMMKVKMEKEMTIGYIANADVTAWTRACPGIRQFIDQRVRWASKAVSYRDIVIAGLALLVWCANFSVLWMLFKILSLGSFQWYFILLFIIKNGFDFLFVRSVAKFFSKQNLLVYYPAIMFIYPFYVVLIPLISVFYKPGWKGRHIRI